MKWNGESVLSSMVKRSVPGPLVVHPEHIEGNSFGLPTVHGNPDAVLYAFGMKSAQAYADALGIGPYTPGLTGETITLDELEETEVSVGDIFSFGEVLAQAVYPRIPCNRLNIRLHNPRAQATMKECGRSGVYFRILRPGKIFLTDTVKLEEKAAHRYAISKLYRQMTHGEKLSDDEKRLMLANGAFRKNKLEQWAAELAAADQDGK
jgi:MOSC domain-containing protein YiiM